MTARHDILATALQAIYERHGAITPDMVVEAARDPASPLHECFEWDDAAAAQAHRRDQARALLRSIRVNVTTETVRLEVPYYYRDPSLPGDDQGYVAITKIRSDADIARDVLVDEFSRAAAALRRAREAAAAFGLTAEVEELHARAVALSDGLTAMAAAS